MNFELEFLIKYMPSLLDGLALTLIISGIAIVFSVLFGLLFGVLRAKRIPVVSQVIVGYVEFVRNTPFPVQLFFIFFALPTIGLTIPGTAAGTIALIISGTAYATDNFRAGFEAVPSEPVQAAKALGFRSFAIFWAVELPLATRISLRSVGNTVIIVLKQSAVLYLVSVHELTYTAINIALATYRLLEVFLFMGIVYIGIVLALSGLLRAYERRLNLEVTTS